MTPGTLNVPIYKGAKYEHALTFYQAGTTTPVDLTGLGEFKFTVSHPTNDTVKATGTVTVTNAALGKLTITVPANQTSKLSLGTARIGLRDGQDNPYIANSVDVLFFANQPD